MTEPSRHDNVADEALLLRQVAQGQLAALASIRPAALSKFLSNGGALNDLARIRLTLALPKIAARKLEAA